jgi:isopentenyl diphosphate isomerase/L-lactate dehydrogenase-like FMN-dependent dehydrogenase
MDQRGDNTGLETEFVTIHEFVKAARMNLNPNVWDYLIGGTESETTLARNRAALDQIALRPRVLRDVSKVDPGTQFLGKSVRLPTILAPVGSLEQFDEGGGLTVAEAAGRFGVSMMLSSVTTKRLEDVRAKTAAPLIYQLYVRGDDGFVDEQAAYAIGAGCDAFCITVDTQHYSRRERDIAKRFQKSWRNASNTEEARGFQAAFSWKDVERFKAKHDIPFILKGIGTAEDAHIAVEHGVEYVYCSNHGGRQLDHGRGSADVVQEIIEAVDGKAQVIVDGSVSRGTDIVKVMALGCAAVGIGRLYCYGLAARGAEGVIRLLEILEDETIKAMGLAGVSSYDELDRSYLHFGAPIVTRPHVHSAFPLLNLDDPGYGGR